MFQTAEASVDEGEDVLEGDETLGVVVGRRLEARHEVAGGRRHAFLFVQGREQLEPANESMIER